MRYQIKNAIVMYGADTILDHVCFEVRDREKIAIVGRNGCGKTTFLKLIAGDIEMVNPDSDEEAGIYMAGRQEIGYLRQINFPDGEISVREEIMKVFRPIFEAEQRMKEIEKELENGEDRVLFAQYDELQKKMEAMGGYSWKTDMEIMFQKFGFAPEDMERPIGTFSGGQQTKVAFIKLLLSRPDIMLLDEPTNHLDLPTIEWLEGYLKSYDKAVIIVSHDRMFLDRVTDVTYEIEYHRMTRYSGNYSAFMKMKEEALEKQEKDYEAQQKEIQRLTQWIEQWKNTPSKVSATHSKRMAIEHMVKIEKPMRFDTKAFRANFTPRIESYSEVISATGLKIGYDRVLATVNMNLQKKERMAIIGENGIGKSTLLKTLVGMLEPMGGGFRYGANVEWGYFDQQLALMNHADPEQTVLENFWEDYPSLLREDVRSALGAFLFSQEEVTRKMGQLSGGEKVRLELCKMFYTRPNLLILDEPTNHMDIIGKEALEKMLRDFDGTVLFVSHDRYFIQQVATRVLEFGTGEVRQYDCNYDGYLEEKSRRQAGIIKDTYSAKSGEQNGKAAPPTTSAGAGSKDRYFNPGKRRSQLNALIAKLNLKLEESEEKVRDAREKLNDPELASDYEKLMEFQKVIDTEEENQESLLEQLMQAEEELEELQES